MTPQGAAADPRDGAGTQGDGARAARVLLVGMMGAGKTTVGRLLAARLGWGYADSDEAVETRTGRTVKELFESGGERAFRPLESEALAAAVSAAAPIVVAVAGGAVLDPANRALLRRAGTVVWLRASPATLLDRVTAEDRAGDDHRPLLETGPAATLSRLDSVRRALYEEVADVVVDVDDLEPDAVVDRIVAAVRP